MTAIVRKGRFSRRLSIAILVFAPLAVLPTGCKLFHRERMQSVVNTRDPHIVGQLLDGFYGVEAGAWRWTAKQFSVKLKTPAGAAQKGATLRVVLTVPPQVIDKSGPITLSGRVGGVSLAPETYSAPGAYVYQRQVPAAELSKADVTIAFSLDKSMVPGGPDLRDLGIVVTTLSLE